MSTPEEIFAGTAVELFLSAAALGVLYRIWGKYLPTPRRQRVLAFQRGVLFQDERVEKVLVPGTYWISSKRTLLICDMRARPFQISAQEIAMSDGMAVRLSLSGEYHTGDPSAFTISNSDPYGAFYLEARQALHIASKEFTGRSIIDDSSFITSRVRELLIPKATHLGLEVTQLSVSEILPIGWFRQS